MFDLNGWDVRKALQLPVKGNATLVEWLTSPVVLVLERPDAPPMAFGSLVRGLVNEPAVLKDIDDLLTLKRRIGAHGRGRRFEPCTAHQRKSPPPGQFAPRLLLRWSCKGGRAR